MDGSIGVSYIPTRELGSKSRSDSNSDGDTGTYKAKAELDNVFNYMQTFQCRSLGFDSLR